METRAVCYLDAKEAAVDGAVVPVARAPDRRHGEAWRAIA